MFAVFVDPVQPTPMDSIKPVACAPNKLELVFRRPINCNSISPDGSDFTVTGSTPVTVTGASGNCVNGVTTSIFIQLSAPIQTAGNYQVHLKPGIDGNTIIARLDIKKDVKKDEAKAVQGSTDAPRRDS